MRWMTITSLVLALLVAAPAFGQQEEPTQDEPKSPAEQYRELLQEYREVRQPAQFAAKFLELAKSHAEDPAAMDALVWVVSNIRTGDEPAQAIGLLEKNHLDSPRLGAVCLRLAGSPSLLTEQFLRQVIEKSPHRDVQGQACYGLAGYLKQEAMIVELMQNQPELAKRVAQFYGSQLSQHLASLDGPSLTKEREALYERIIDSFADVEVYRGNLGKAAERELFEIRFLSVGRTAPEIEGEDIDEVAFKLTDYRGSVVVLDFWGHW